MQDQLLRRRRHRRRAAVQHRERGAQGRPLLRSQAAGAPLLYHERLRGVRKASLEQLELRGCPVIPPGPELAPEDYLRATGEAPGGAGALRRHGRAARGGALRQGGRTRGAPGGRGRHNATDKLVGWALLEGRLPLSDHIVMVSGRSSFEILQKCPDRRGTHRVRHLRPEQPRGRRSPAVRHDAGGVLAGKPLQRI